MPEVRYGKEVVYAARLRAAGFRATFGRVKLLELLAKNQRPLRVETIAKAMGKHMDQANAYRALEAFAERGLVRRVDLGHPHTHYEIAMDMREHPHSFIGGLCRVCICI